MEFLDKHKALLITILIMGIISILIFGMSMKLQTEQLAESYYELLPQKTLEEKLLEELAFNDNASQSTNKAYNEASDFKELMKNFKSLNPNDFNKTTKQAEAEEVEEMEEAADVKNNATSEETSDSEVDMDAYSKINDVIAKRSAEKRKSTAANSSVNRNSSVSYSLKGRKDEHLPPPIYLCEESGKIVINISVNSNGAVVNSSVNSAASNSTNECLIDSALEYASNARFSSDATTNQIGTITYSFVGKN